MLHVGQYRSQFGPRVRTRGRRKPRTTVTMHAVFSDGYVLRSVMDYNKLRNYKNHKITHAWRVTSQRKDGTVGEVAGFSTSYKRAETDMKTWVRMARPRPVVFAGVAEAREGDATPSAGALPAPSPSTL